MRVATVITACNENPMYLQYVPLFIHTWGKVFPKVHVIVVLIMQKLPTEFEPFVDNIVVIPPVAGVPTAFNAQYIRLLYPSLLGDEVGAIMTTDVDMVPLKTPYWSAVISPGEFCLFPERPARDQIAMCYCAAHSSVWRDIFQIKDRDNIRKRMQAVSGSVDFRFETAWYTDQKDLYNYVMNWGKKWGKKITQLRKPISRLDRADTLSPSLIARIRSQEFDDFHMFRSGMLINEMCVSMATDPNDSSVLLFPPRSLIPPH